MTDAEIVTSRCNYLCIRRLGRSDHSENSEHSKNDDDEQDDHEQIDQIHQKHLPAPVRRVPALI